MVPPTPKNVGPGTSEKGLEPLAGLSGHCVGAASAVASGEGTEPAAAVGARSVAALFCWRAWRASHVHRGPLLRRSTTLRAAQCGPVASPSHCAAAAERVSHGAIRRTHSGPRDGSPCARVARIAGLMSWRAAAHLGRQRAPMSHRVDTMETSFKRAVS